jgi:hypothetical protein
MSRGYSVSHWGKGRRALIAGVLLAFLTALFFHLPARTAKAAAGAPELLTQGATTRAVALESVNWRQEPFSPTQVNQFGADSRTRLILFARNLDLQPGEGASAVTAEAEDSTRARYPLAVEYAGGVPGFDWLGMVVVRLHDAIGDVGDVLIGVRLRGVASNRVRVGIGRVGGGPPDDDPGGQPDLGPNASLHGRQVFPADNPWNEEISAAPVDPNSDAIITSMGLNTGVHADFGTVWNGAPNGIPYVVVSGAQQKVPITFTDYGDESDPGPYPVPPDALVEGGASGTGDRHVIVIDRDNWKLYELSTAYPVNNGASWRAGSGAVFDLNSNALRPAGWTSADAAGLPIFPGLVRYDEVYERGEITHALRFTAQTTRRAYVAPARHFASSRTDANLPPMGMRVRLKASFDTSGFSPAMQVILRALKKYGMILADNGSNWYVSGAPDPRWNDDELHTLSALKGSDFEVVKMGTVVTR